MDQLTAEQLAHERLVHASALRLLGEVRDYLRRLPVVPLTRDHARKIDDFLIDPGAVAATRRAYDQERLEEVWEAGCYSADGRPVLRLEVRRSSVILAGRTLKPLTNRAATVGPDPEAIPALELELRKSTEAAIPSRDASIRFLPDETR